MELSRFGHKFSEHSGILQLMDDLGKAMSSPGAKAMFGGGNPAVIPAVTKIYMKHLQQIATDEEDFIAAFGNYDTPQGNAPFIDSLVKFLNRNYGWQIEADNIAITPGSQSGFFSLLNMLAGEQPDGSIKKIVFPVVPEYIGYSDQGLHSGMMQATKPKISLKGKHEFKYHVDFDKLTVDDSTAALCISRPTNPSGNVIDDKEIEHLRRIARDSGVPLIIDNAYGLPFPGVIDAETPPKWDENIIYSMSLSKIGLPAVRTGIFIAKKSIAHRLTNITAVLNLANTNIGQIMLRPMLDDDSILDMSRQHIKPFYERRAAYMKKAFDEHFDSSLPWRLHSHEGSYFFWLWLPDLPITTLELYERLKKRHVIVVPGEYFFPGLKQKWEHRDRCLRINFSRPEEEVRRGVPILAEEIANAYASA